MFPHNVKRGDVVIFGDGPVLWKVVDLPGIEPRPDAFQLTPVGGPMDVAWSDLQAPQWRLADGYEIAADLVRQLSEIVQ